MILSDVLGKLPEPCAGKTGRAIIMKDITDTALSLGHIEHYSARLAATTDLQKLCDFSLELTQKFFGFDYSTLLLLDDKQAHLVLRATRGFPQEMVDTFVIERGKGLPSLALQTGRVETVADFRSEDRFEVTAIMAKCDICSAMAAPMRIGDRFFGVLIGHTLQQRLFSLQEQQVYQVLANHTAVAIKNAQTIFSLRRSEEKRSQKIRELQREKTRVKELKDEFESIFSTITTGVLLLQDDRKVVRCNEKLAEILGYDSTRPLRGVSASKLHLSEEKYRAFGKKHYSQLLAGKTVQTEYELRKKEGGAVLCRLSGRTVDQAIPPDLSKGFVWLVEDISRRRQMEKEVLQARKLESIGILAGGIGHDYNNILSAILGNLGLCKRMLEPDHAVQELLNSALEAADKARDLTEKLLLFTRRQRHSPGSVSVPQLFKEFRFEEILRAEIDLRVNFQQGLFTVKIMPDHLKVILQNLLVNADNCMPEGGQVTVTGCNSIVLEEDIPGLASGKYVEIEVADNGSGIEQDIQDNIFDPYFTTKNRDSSKGIGLGLAIVHAIVKKNHGSISVRPGSDSGTVFTVLLPAVVDDIVLSGKF